LSLPGASLRHLLMRDQAVAKAVLCCVTVVAWTYLLVGAGMDMDHAGMSLTEPMAMAWSLGFATAVFAMWAVMMVAMMLPSAAPMILLFDTISLRRNEQGERAVATSVFTGGYLIVWISFAAAATLLQYGLEQTLVMSMAMRTTSSLLAGGILICAGIYQLTPLKQACLRHCRSPLDFVVTRWRKGTRGAFIMGCEHGAYCLGCCWVLMALLFVGGVMNLLWIAALSLYVLAEKVLPATHWLSRLAGALLIVWGGATMAATI
jgi:predicted metal-binding membrane protein